MTLLDAEVPFVCATGPMDGERPSSLGGSDAFLRRAPRPITHAGQLAVAVGDSGDVRSLGAPERLALPALHVVDRQIVPADQSTGAVELLRRCLAVVGVPTRPRAGRARRWPVTVAGGTFAGQVPPGAATDPRSLTISAYAVASTAVRRASAGCVRCPRP